MRSTYAAGVALILTLAAGCSSDPDQDVSDAAPARSGASAQPNANPEGGTPTTIPQGFLLYDKQAAANPGPWTAENGVGAPSFCPPGNDADVPQERAARTLQYRPPGEGLDDGSGPQIDHESLRLYATEDVARQMMDAVRAAVRLCAGAKDDEGNEIHVSQEPIDIGDEAINVRFDSGGDSSEVEIWVRRGTAVAAYGPSPVPINGDTPQAEQDARTMAAKLCRYDGGC